MKIPFSTLTETRFWLVCFFRGNPSFAALCALVCVRVGHTFSGKCFVYMHIHSWCSRFSHAIDAYQCTCIICTQRHAFQWREGHIHMHVCCVCMNDYRLRSFISTMPYTYSGLDGKCGGWKRTILIHYSLWKWKACAHSKLFPNPKENEPQNVLENWILYFTYKMFRENKLFPRN